MYWIDHTDYCPSAYGFGDDPTEPNWNYECSNCGHHIFSEYLPAICPECKQARDLEERMRAS